MSVKNASTLPKRYFGLHFLPGVAEYREPGSEPYRIFINENTIRSMNSSFEGRPVYALHVDEVDLSKIQTQADGFVVRSFYNAADGKTWVEFLVVSDRGHEAIRSGWKLSNAYIPKGFAGGGLWNGVEYSKEVTSGEFEHLAIVPNPRYEESIILTPDEFKAYNANKENELKRLANSNENKGESMFKLFKKTKVENAAEFESMVVTLPKSGKEITISQLVNDMDEMEKKKDEPQMADEDHMINMGEGAEKMSIKDLKNAYMAMKQELADMKKPKEDAPKENAESDEEKKKKEDEAKKNAEDEAAKKAEDEKKKNEESEMNKAKNAHYEALKNAPHTAVKDQPIHELSEDKVERGKARYGS